MQGMRSYGDPNESVSSPHLKSCSQSSFCCTYTSTAARHTGMMVKSFMLTRQIDGDLNSGAKQYFKTIGLNDR